MHRETLTPRPNFVERIEEVGFTYHTIEKPEDDSGLVFWDETTCYAFSLDEVEAIEAASEELHARCLDAVDHASKRPDIMDWFQIPRAFQPYVTESWRRRDPYVMGRFDLAFDPATKAVKMLEYNADTPTLVIETALVQWMWLQDKFPKNDQFNSLHDKLIEQYKMLAALIPAGTPIHFSATDGVVEETQHVTYFMDLAQQAGLNTLYIPMDRVGWNEKARQFRDENERQIQFWSKLYPWEWMVNETFGQHLLHDSVGVIEPIWKMLLSNKMLLPLLHSMFPDHPNILRSSVNKPEGADYVEKRILSREGQNIAINKGGRTLAATDGIYADSPVIYQEYVKLPEFDGKHVVIGSWMVGEHAAGMILREGDGPIVLGTDRVVPHYVR